MPKRQRGKRQSQHDKFVALANESGASGSESAFVSKLKRLAAKSPAEKPKRPKRA
jgi:hypothetical protein